MTVLFPTTSALYAERPIMIQNGDTTIAMARVATLIEFAAEQARIPIFWINTRRWRSMLWPGNNFRRPQAKRAALEWCKAQGLEITDDNLAEALCIAHCGYLIEQGRRS